MKTWVYIDHFKGEAVSASWEALGVGKTFGPVSALIFGSGMEMLTQAAFEFGAYVMLAAFSLAYLVGQLRRGVTVKG